MALIMKLLASLLLALLPTVAGAVDCLPKSLGGEGVNADFSINLDGSGWIVYWCPSASKGPQLQLLVSPGWAATTAGFRCAIRSAQGPAQTVDTCAPGGQSRADLKEVWEPDILRIALTRPK